MAAGNVRLSLIWSDSAEAERNLEDEQLPMPITVSSSAACGSRTLIVSRRP